MQKILLIILGWLLGILSPILQEKMQQKRNTKKISAAIITELNDLEYRLMFLAFGLFTHIGKMNKDFLSWAASVKENYSGPFVNEETNNAIVRLSALSDDEITRLFPDRSQTKGLRMSKMMIPFTQSKVDSLTHFPTDFQKQIFSILSQLSYLNDNIDFSMEDFDRMLDPDIDRENWCILRDNIIERWQAMGNRARQIADKIKQIRIKYSD
jgi:hypothetical protein